MKKTMLSLGVFALLGLSTQVFGQVETATEGPLSKDAVGINTDEPTATLDVNGGARVRKARAAVLPTDPKVKATEILVVDKDGNLLRLPISTTTLQELVGSAPTSGAQPGGTVNGFPAQTKLGKTIASIRTKELPMLATDWTDSDYTIVIKGDGDGIALPSAKNNKGRILCIRNGETTNRTYFGSDIPKNNGAIGGNRGQVLQSDGEYWWVIGGF
ncbi:hypothetical protein ACQ1Q1_05945 [Ornithobacterium rhinotracheale]|nr:hypothetical protein [Ornithobacterium rhinotracheale]MBN3661823.1 hypothetical protein [Ornithobacterium rhinotracheale]MCK0195020.1 hypothetical protein [Ornithobacterium rhinotracheale]MCK0202145.1 hypothetical protein [Ornithobacterium rhinotracheale]UOH62745.1 hypothetical protein MT993_06860 [Ornithobacterium rhinotracheale]UOH65048.1 hypothetical protein MT999_07550 [Ornithobacterium rhinotracheale]